MLQRLGALSNAQNTYEKRTPLISSVGCLLLFLLIYFFVFVAVVYFSHFFLFYFVVDVVVVVIVVVVVSSVFKPCLYLYAISTDFFGKNLSITPVVEISFCYHLEETILPGVALNTGNHLTIFGRREGGGVLFCNLSVIC